MTTCALSKTLAVVARDHLLFSSDQRGETCKDVMDHWFYCEITHVRYALSSDRSHFLYPFGPPIAFALDNDWP